MKVTNFTFAFGCDPGCGVAADTAFAQNFITLMMNQFDVTNGSIDIPLAFNNIISTDAKIETTTSNLSQELRLFRQDDVVGSKMLIFATSPGKMTDEKQERLTFVQSFFKRKLGFKDEEIVVVPLVLHEIENSSDLILRADEGCLNAGKVGK